jgi:hypothetical protein
MTKKPPLMTPALKAFAAERYLADVPPRDLVQELKAKFGVDVKPAALRQWLTRSGLGVRRRALDTKTCALVSSAKLEALAKTKAAAPRLHLARWAETTVTVADKALEMAAESTKPRDLASATSAASAAIRLFRLCAGLDGPESGPASRIQFNYNFSNIVPLIPGQAQATQGVVEVVVSPASDVEASEMDKDGG